MRLAMFVGAAVSIVAAGVAAAPGDPLIVTGDGVNVRAGPSTSAAILLRAYRNQEAIELARDGEWVRLEIAGTAGQEGWIHSSLLARPGGQPLAEEDAATATPEPPDTTTSIAEGGMEAGETAMVPELSDSDRDPAAGTDVAVASPEAGTAGVAPGAGPVVAGPELSRFKESVDYLNKRAMQVAGVDLFTEVEAVDDLMVKVGTTDAWTTVPPAGQRSYMNTLLDRWHAANGGATPVTLQVVDPEGQILAEETRP
jgi:hypothetical protein